MHKGQNIKGISATIIAQQWTLNITGNFCYPYKTSIDRDVVSIWDNTSTIVNSTIKATGNQGTATMAITVYNIC